VTGLIQHSSPLKLGSTSRFDLSAVLEVPGFDAPAETVSSKAGVAGIPELCCPNFINIATDCGFCLSYDRKFSPNAPYFRLDISESTGW